MGPRPEYVDLVVVEHAGDLSAEEVFRLVVTARNRRLPPPLRAEVDGDDVRRRSRAGAFLDLDDPADEEAEPLEIVERAYALLLGISR